MGSGHAHPPKPSVAFRPCRPLGRLPTGGSAASFRRLPGELVRRRQQIHRSTSPSTCGAPLRRAGEHPCRSAGVALTSNCSALMGRLAWLCRAGDWGHQMSNRYGLWAAAIVMALGATSGANADILKFDLSNNENNHAESWLLDTTTIVQDDYIGDPIDFIQAPIFADTAGRTAIYFGNASTRNQFGLGRERGPPIFGVDPVFIGGANMPFFTGPNTSPILLFHAGDIGDVPRNVEIGGGRRCPP